MLTLPRYDVVVGHAAHCAILPALQGAFVEHQAILQKLSLRTRLHVVLVRTPEDLQQCDALIIPGGGESSVKLLGAGLPSLVCHVRIDYHCAARAPCWFAGASKRVREGEAGVGDLRRCDITRAVHRGREKGRSGATGRDLGDGAAERLGITSAYMLFSGPQQVVTLILRPHR